MLVVPDPMRSDVETARYYHDDVPHLDERSLVIELRRAGVAIAIVRRDDARDWFFRRRAAVVAELDRRGLVIR